METTCDTLLQRQLRRLSRTETLLSHGRRAAITRHVIRGTWLKRDWNLSRLVKWYDGIVWNLATITQILLGECMLNFVQYGACLHLSVQNVWGAHCFLDTLYFLLLYLTGRTLDAFFFNCTDDAGTILETARSVQTNKWKRMRLDDHRVLLCHRYTVLHPTNDCYV